MLCCSMIMRVRGCYLCQWYMHNECLFSCVQICFPHLGCIYISLQSHHKWFLEYNMCQLFWGNYAGHLPLPPTWGGSKESNELIKKKIISRDKFRGEWVIEREWKKRYLQPCLITLSLCRCDQGLNLDLCVLECVHLFKYTTLMNSFTNLRICYI